MALIRRGIHFGSYGQVDNGSGVFSRLVEAAQAAEEAGFDALSIPDYVHQNQNGGGSSGRGIRRLSRRFGRPRYRYGPSYLAQMMFTAEERGGSGQPRAAACLLVRSSRGGYRDTPGQDGSVAGVEQLDVVEGGASVVLPVKASVDQDHRVEPG